MLEDIILSDSLRYEQHALIYGTDDPIRIEGAFGAALLCALLVDTEEGNRRTIAIDTDEDKNEWIKRYEREVRRDGWGLIEKEVNMLEAKGIRCDERSFTCKGSMGPLHSGHPNQQDLADLRAFIEKTIK